MVRISPRGLLGIAFLGLTAISRADAPASNISPSPAADTELICPNDNPGDCYPRIFVPTKDFQVIKEGQDIPPGLHVQMDIYTGLKQARLNIPMEGEDTAALENIPMEQAMVVVEQPEGEEIVQERPALRDQYHEKPPAYEAAGKIPPPPPTSGDLGTFQTAKLLVSVGGRGFDKSLDDLSELAHDIYYGVEITKEGPLLEKLVCLALGSGSERFPAKEKKRDHKAASILAAAIQNNPTALEEVSKMGKLVMYPICEDEGKETKTTGKGLVAILRSRLGREKEPATLKAKVSLISNLLRDSSIRSEFLETGGMELLLAIWLKKGDQWDTVRQKVAQLVMDNFLDEGMGAAMGVWPKGLVADDEVCKMKGSMLEDGCWEYHVRKFLDTSSNPDWGMEFMVALSKSEGRTKGRHKEL
jgi:nucleotide exchange factor SIL1